MTVAIHHGDCLDVLARLPEASAHCIVTSPPYWRQRDYGIAGQIGQEPTPEEYVARLVAIFAAARRLHIRRGGDAAISGGGLIAFAWYVWDRAHVGPPALGWIDPDEPDRAGRIA